MVLHEEVRSSTKVSEGGPGHVRGRSDKWVQGKGRVTSVISAEPLLVCNGDGQVDR